jgi:tetratricopeptide (TPR) repeat protein
MSCYRPFAIRPRRARINDMFRLLSSVLAVLCLGTWVAAQVDQLPPSDKEPGPNEAPPRYDRDREAGVSSSRDTKIDISPPKEDAKEHPNSGTGEQAESANDTQELRPWNPHRALKDIEVGDFYLRRKNYHAALDRYQEALLYKPGDAVANFRMGECFEKLDKPEEATAHYQEYLRILPQGPLSGEAQKALRKLQTGKNQASGAHPPKP